MSEWELNGTIKITLEDQFAGPAFGECLLIWEQDYEIMVTANRVRTVYNGVEVEEFSGDFETRDDALSFADAVLRKVRT